VKVVQTKITSRKSKQILPVQTEGIPPEIQNVLPEMVELIAKSMGFEMEEFDLNNVRDPRLQGYATLSVELLLLLQDYCRDYFGTGLEDLIDE
jgi:hypothetical protein